MCTYHRNCGTYLKIYQINKTQISLQGFKLNKYYNPKSNREGVELVEWQLAHPGSPVSGNLNVPGNWIPGIEWLLYNYLIVKIFCNNVNVSGLLHLLRALHAEADLGDLADHIGLPKLFFYHGQACFGLTLKIKTNFLRSNYFIICVKLVPLNTKW